jgi:Ca2+-binding RTX toxin-like protein
MKRIAILGVLAGALLLLMASGVALTTTERGTRGDDLLVGTERDDRLVGRNGDDRLKALEGNDTPRGGNGKDELLARDG